MREKCSETLDDASYILICMFYVACFYVVTWIRSRNDDLPTSPHMLDTLLREASIIMPGGQCMRYEHAETYESVHENDDRGARR
jgi:hypothetical protein